MHPFEQRGLLVLCFYFGYEYEYRQLRWVHFVSIMRMIVMFDVPPYPKDWKEQTQTFSDLLLMLMLLFLLFLWGRLKRQLLLHRASQSRRDETQSVVHISNKARKFVDVISFRAVLSSFSVHNASSSLSVSTFLVGNKDSKLC